MPYVLYRTTSDHSADCKAFPFDMIPKRVFLDTNVVNCLVKWSDCVFEHAPASLDLESELRSDIESLKHIFMVGSRANWDIVVSEKVVDELAQTPNEHLRDHLLDYGGELMGYCRSGLDETGRHARDLARRLVDSPFLASLPDRSDRELIAHALGLECDAFCTCDRKSIHRRKERLRGIPLRILTPVEWWQHIKPWAALWA